MLLDQINSAQRARKLEADYFVYTAIWNTLGANSVAPVNIGIQVDSDFVIIKSYLTAYSAAGTPVVAPDYLAQFFDTGSGRSYQDQPLHVNNVFGVDAGHPFVWSEPKLIKGGSVLTVTLTNQTALAARVDVALVGFKVFYFPGFNRDLLSSY